MINPYQNQFLPQGQLLPQGQQLIQNNQQNIAQNPQGVSSPISSGAFAGMQAARQSFELGNQDRQRALGIGISKFFANMAKPGYGRGFNGALSAAAQSFEPAMQAYSQESNRLQDLNQVALKLAMERELQNERMNLERQRIDEQSRHHRVLERESNLRSSLINQERKEALDEKHYFKNEEKRIKEDSGDDVKSIVLMPKSTQNRILDKISDYRERKNSATIGRDAAIRIQQIATEHPDILNNFKYVAGAAFNKNEGYINNAISRIAMSPEERAAFTEMANLTKVLFLESNKGIPAAGQNQAIQQMLKQATVGAHMPKESIIAGLEKAIHEFDYGIEEYGKGLEYGKRGYLYEPSAIESYNDGLIKKLIKEYPELEEDIKADPEVAIKEWKSRNK